MVSKGRHCIPFPKKNKQAIFNVCKHKQIVRHMALCRKIIQKHQQSYIQVSINIKTNILQEPFQRFNP